MRSSNGGVQDVCISSCEVTYTYIEAVQGLSKIDFIPQSIKRTQNRTMDSNQTSPKIHGDIHASFWRRIASLVDMLIAPLVSMAAM